MAAGSRRSGPDTDTLPVATLEAVLMETLAPGLPDGQDGILRPPCGMSAREIEEEVAALLAACEVQQSVLRELALAVDRATFGLRESRTRIERLREELGRRSAARAIR